MSDHVADRAGFIAALSRNDPERRAAEEHAQSCASCREALEEGAQLVAVLKETVPLDPPTPAAVARAAAAIEKETAEEMKALRRLVGLCTGALVVSWLFQLMVGGGWVLNAKQLTVSLGVLAVAAASLNLLWGRERLAVVAILAVSALLAYGAGTSAGLEPHIGIRCWFRELWAAVIPWAVVQVGARRAGIPLGRWNVTVVASAGALAAHAGQHLACQVPHSEAHLFVFHFSAVVLATLLGAVSARRWNFLAT
jgi:hypothetical protein